MVFGVAQWNPPGLNMDKNVSSAIATVSAATNAALIARRNHNAFNTKCPLQHDVNAIVRKVLTTVCTAATAARTTAEREETRIYTHYEGWLPDDDDLPTTAWRRTWCERGHGFLRDTQPRAALAFQLPLSHAAPNPHFDLNDPAVLTRTGQRHNEVSY